MKKVLPGVLFALFFPAVLPATAQIMSNPGQWYINNQIYSTRVFNGVVANSMLRTKGTKDNRTRPTNPALSKNNKPTADYTVFRENPGNSLAKLFAGKAGGSRQDQQDAEKLFASFINLYKQTARKDGFPANDLAYAFEYFVVNNYQIYHDLMDLPLEKDPRARRARDGFERITLMNQKKSLQVTLPQERAIYNQFKTVLAANAEIQKMTDAQKQEAAELFAILFGVNFTAYMKGITDGNDELTDQARKMAMQGLEKLLGAPISRIKIANNGLEL